MKAPKIFIKYINEEKNINEIIDWVMTVSGEEMDVETVYVTDKPKGDCQGDYEYCDQVTNSSESGIYAFSGTYYHKFEDSDLWLAYEYCMSA